MGEKIDEVLRPETDERRSIAYTTVGPAATTWSAWPFTPAALSCCSC